MNRSYSEEGNESTEKQALGSNPQRIRRKGRLNQTWKRPFWRKQTNGAKHVASLRGIRVSRICFTNALRSYWNEKIYYYYCCCCCCYYYYYYYYHHHPHSFIYLFFVFRLPRLSFRQFRSVHKIAKSGY